MAKWICVECDKPLIPANAATAGLCLECNLIRRIKYKPYRQEIRNIQQKRYNKMRLRTES